MSNDVRFFGNYDSRRRGVARLALVWLLGCLAAGGGLLAAGANHAAAPAAAAGSSARPHTKAIEDVRVGDWVLAKDPGQAGPPTPHRVVALPRNWTEHVAHVRLEGGGELLATRSHPFWAEGRGWVDAADLRAGDRLVDDAGRPAAVAGVEVEERTCDTYNLTVEGVHTYYALAGETPVLVHNAPFGDVAGGGPIDGNQVLTTAEQWLGAGYREIAPGVFRSADNARQFRMTESDLLGNHGNIGPHVHYESIGPDGRTITENSHVAACP